MSPDDRSGRHRPDRRRADDVHSAAAAYLSRPAWPAGRLMNRQFNCFLSLSFHRAGRFVSGGPPIGHLPDESIVGMGK